MIIHRIEIKSQVVQLGVRIAIAVIGFCTIALLLASDKLLRDFVLYLPLTTFAAVLTDFGKVELTSVFGLSHGNFIKAKKLIRIFVVAYVLSLLVLRFAPDYLLPKLDYLILFLSLTFLGLVQVPIDVILRGILFSERKTWPIYLYQGVLSLSSVITCLFGYLNIIGSEIIVIIYASLPTIILSICFHFRLIRFSPSFGMASSHSIKIKAKSLFMKSLPILIYSLLTLLIDRKFSGLGLEIGNRVFFFLIGFFMVRITAREKVFKKNTHYLIAFIVSCFGLSFVLQVASQLSEITTRDFLMNIVARTFLSPIYVIMMLVMSIVYSFFIASYQKFIHQDR